MHLPTFQLLVICPPVNFVLVGGPRQVARELSGPQAVKWPKGSVARGHSGPTAQWPEGWRAGVGCADVGEDTVPAPQLHPWEVNMPDGDVLGAIRGSCGEVLAYLRAPTEKAYRNYAVWGLA